MNQCASPSVRASFCMFEWQYGGREKRTVKFNRGARSQLWLPRSMGKWTKTIRMWIMSQILHNHAIHVVSFTYDAWKKYDFYGCCLLGFELLKSSIMSKIYRINEMNYHWRNIWYFCYRLHLWNYAAIKLDFRMKWF